MYLIETCLSTSWNWHFTPQYVLFNSAFRLYEFTRYSRYLGYPNGNSRDVQLTSSISMVIKFGLPLTLTTEMRKITTESNNMFKFRPECWWSLPTLNFYIQHRHTPTTLCHCWSGRIVYKHAPPTQQHCAVEKVSTLHVCGTAVLLRYHVFNFDTIYIRYLQNLDIDIDV